MNALANKVWKYLKAPSSSSNTVNRFNHTENKKNYSMNVVSDSDYVIKWYPDQREVNNVPADVDFSKLRFLIAEDYLGFHVIYEDVLRSSGAKAVDIVADGNELYERFTSSGEGYYHVILSEVYLPGMGGYKVAEKIREMDRADAKTVIYIAMSCAFRENSMKNNFILGVDGFLGKPIKIDSLINILEKYL